TLVKPNYIHAYHPDAYFSTNKTSGCVGQQFSFINMSSGGSTLSYNWNFGDNTTSIQVNPYHSYAAAGSYTVRLIATDSLGCSDTMTVPAAITITRPTAAFNLSDTVAVCPPLHVSFTNTAIGASSIAWTFGNGGVSVLNNPQTTYTSTGLYTVRL